jgi:hypothetical protein
MKKWMLALLLIIGSAAFAQPLHPPQITQPLNLLYRLDESRQLLEKVESEGQLTIKSSHFGANQSNAAWVPSERAIYLNFGKRRTVGSIIASIVFELHNALSDQQFDYYDELAKQGKISRDQYIAAIEHVEYLNACNASKILEKGIRMGVFPYDAEWPVPSNFQQHFHIQQMAGHSAIIGQMYDSLMYSTNYQR